MRAGVEVRGGAGVRHRREHVIDLGGIEERVLHVRIEPERRDALAPELVQTRGRAVVREPLDHRGRPHEGVVGAVRHRAVTGRPRDPQAAPGDSLLPHRDPDERRLARSTVQPTALGQHVVGVDRVTCVIGHPLHPVRAARLLVGDAEVDQVAARAEPGGGEVVERDRHRRRQVEHVDRTATPHLAVDQLAAERIATPPRLVDRDDVGVAHQAQARSVPVGALDAGHHRGTTGRRLEPLDVEAGGAEVRGERVCVAALEPRPRRPVVHAPVADQGLQQLDRAAGQVVAHAPGDYARCRHDLTGLTSGHPAPGASGDDRRPSSTAVIPAAHRLAPDETRRIADHRSSRWRSLGALLRPDATRWAILGVLLASRRRSRSAVRWWSAGSSIAPADGTSAAAIVQVGRDLPRDRRRRAADRRRGRLVRDHHCVADDEPDPDPDDTARARPRPRVPPPAHAR